MQDVFKVWPDIRIKAYVDDKKFDVSANKGGGGNSMRSLTLASDEEGKEAKSKVLCTSRCTTKDVKNRWLGGDVHCREII